MWPKAIAQLVELLPHVARLLPHADRFFNAKAADAEASRTAMEQMAAGLRGDLGQVTASHAGLYRQLNEQSEKLGNLAADAAATRADLRMLAAEQQRLQKRLAFVLVLAGIGVTLLLFTLIFCGLILFHVHHIY
jgi:septal ring factor EnvC (AmiA/AmiB activator)